MADATRAKLPWMLVASSLLFFVLLLYVLFSSYVPAKQRIAGLESELRAVYARIQELERELAAARSRAR